MKRKRAGQEIIDGLKEATMKKKTRDEVAAEKYAEEYGGIALNVDKRDGFLAGVRYARRAAITDLRKHTPTNKGSPNYEPLYPDEAIEAAIDAIKKRAKL